MRAASKSLEDNRIIARVNISFIFRIEMLLLAELKVQRTLSTLTGGGVA